MADGVCRKPVESVAAIVGDDVKGQNLTMETGQLYFLAFHKILCYRPTS